MDEEKINTAKKNYDTFREELKRKIDGGEIAIYQNESFLIKEPWIQEFIKSFNDYERQSQNANNYRWRKYKSNSSFSFPSQNPELVNDFSSAVDCLKNNNQLKLVNKELIELVFTVKKLNLNKNKCYYYAGNRKLIIDYKSEKNALLLIDPLSNNPKIYVITKTNNERNNIKLYQNILKGFSRYLINNPDYKDNIKTFEDFTKENNKKEEYTIRSRYTKVETIPKSIEKEQKEQSKVYRNYRKIDNAIDSNKSYSIDTNNNTSSYTSIQSRKVFPSTMHKDKTSNTNLKTEDKNERNWQVSSRNRFHRQNLINENNMPKIEEEKNEFKDSKYKVYTEKKDKESENASTYINKTEIDKLKKEVEKLNQKILEIQSKLNNEIKNNEKITLENKEYKKNENENIKIIKLLEKEKNDLIKQSSDLN